MSNLDKYVLKFERIRGDLGGIKNKVIRKIKPRVKDSGSAKRHPFLKAHKLDKGWAEKLDKTAVGKGSKTYNAGTKKTKVTLVKAKSKVNKPTQKVSRRRPQ